MKPIPVRFLACADTFLALALVFASQFLAAQAISGDVVGTVRDNSGATISAVRLTATKIETGVVTTTVTNDRGEFHFVESILPRRDMAFVARDGRVLSLKRIM